MARRVSFEEVREAFENRGLILFETVYVSAKTKMKYRCPKHPDKELSISYDKLKQSVQGCPHCSRERVGDKLRTPIEEVRKAFEDKGLELLETKYVNNKTKMKYRCPKHPDKDLSVTFDSLKSKGTGCPFCGYERIADSLRISFEDVKRAFEERGYVLLETKYVDGHTKMKYRCPNHPTEKLSISYANLRYHDQGCPLCGLDRLRGENNHNWNPDLTDEERKERRQYTEYYQWVRDVYERDDYTCQCCGDRGVKLNAHHLDGYNWCIEKRTDVDNGVTLCEDCHYDFHRQYGYGNNTRQQYEEWLESKRLKRTA